MLVLAVISVGAGLEMLATIRAENELPTVMILYMSPQIAAVLEAHAALFTYRVVGVGVQILDVLLIDISVGQNCTAFLAFDGSLVSFLVLGQESSGLEGHLAKGTGPILQRDESLFCRTFIGFQMLVVLRDLIKFLLAVTTLGGRSMPELNMFLEQHLGFVSVVAHPTIIRILLKAVFGSAEIVDAVPIRFTLRFRWVHLPRRIFILAGAILARLRGKILLRFDSFSLFLFLVVAEEIGLDLHPFDDRP